MDFQQAQAFLEANHRAVVNTIRPNGSVQSSVVVCGPYQGKVGLVSIRGSAAKVRDLRRNLHCTITAVGPDWRSYVVVEGQAQLFDQENTGVEALRQLLRDVYRACGGGEHPDWNDYDEVMRSQQAVVVLVSPDRIYGQIR